MTSARKRKVLCKFKRIKVGEARSASQLRYEPDMKEFENDAYDVRHARARRISGENARLEYQKAGDSLSSIVSMNYDAGAPAPPRQEAKMKYA